MKSYYSLQRDMAEGLNLGLIIDKKDENKEKEDLQQNYARVEIYYQTLNLKRIKQLPTVSVCI